MRRQAKAKRFCSRHSVSVMALGTEMDKQKLQSYLGLLFVVPVLLLFFVSEYRHRTFAGDPEETKLHDVIQNLFEALFGRGRWYAGASSEPFYTWWVLLGCCTFLVWKYRAKLGGLLIRAATALHKRV